jgi:hypothetical protein
MRKEALA